MGENRESETEVYVAVVDPVVRVALVWDFQRVRIAETSELKLGITALETFNVPTSTSPVPGIVRVEVPRFFLENCAAAAMETKTRRSRPQRIVNR